MIWSRDELCEQNKDRAESDLKSSDLLLALRYQLLQLLQLLVFLVIIRETFNLDSKGAFKTISLLSQHFNLLLQHQVFLKMKPLMRITIQDQHFNY